MLNRKYSIDLAGQMAECEANYARIMQLLPDMEQVDQRHFGIAQAGLPPIQFQIVVVERCKYTTMIDINQLPYPVDGAHYPTPESPEQQTPWQQCPLPEPSLQQSGHTSPYFSLRVYHDARMAEVIAYNHHQRLRPSYDYPNDKMYHRDEKAQLNTFLGEWLSHCLQHGHTLSNPIAISAIKNIM